MKIAHAFCFCLTLVLAAQAEELKIVQLSDAHGCSPFFSETAWDEAVSRARALAPDALVLTGDFGDNSHDQADFYPRLAATLNRWNQRLESFSEPVYFALGNDDFQHNYQTWPAELRQTWTTFRQAFGPRYYLNELGNGRAPRRLGGFTWLTLNSQFFSPKNRTPEAPQQAEQTFAWLESELQELQSAGGGPVALLMHIPPSWDLYNRKPGWNLEHIRRLRATLSRYPGPAVILCGHFHRNHLQVLETTASRAVPVMTAGALATKYGYHPNWREYRWQVGPGLNLDEVAYTLHYPEHPEWNATFRFVPRQIGEFFERLSDDQEFYATYVRNIYGHHQDWKRYASDPELRRDLLDEFWIKSE